MGVNEQTAFDVFTERSHPDYADTGMEAGGTGDDMDSWSSDSAIVNNLLVGNFTNASSYSIPAYVAEGAAFDVYTKKSHGSEETGVEVGYTYLGTKISGHVYVDSETGTKTADASTVGGVTLESHKDGLTFTTQADPADGQYKLGVGDGGQYTVYAKHPIFENDSVTVDIQPGESKPDVTLVLGASGLGIGFSRRRIG